MWRSLLKRLFGAWSLEQKFLVFFGTALLASLFPAFWVVQNVAERLIKERTRQAARDFATSNYIVRHFEVYIQDAEKRVSDKSLPLDDEVRKALFELRPELIDSNYSYDVLKIDNQPDFDHLPGEVPETGVEAELLTKLVRELESLRAKTQDDSVAAQDSTAPNFHAFAVVAPTQNTLFAEIVDRSSYYFYYHPVPFKAVCMGCHPSIHPDFEGKLPIRVIRVGMPHQSTRVWTIWSFSIMIAIAIATLVITLFLFHRILKSLVMRPLGHLHEVSDEISRGQTDRRAMIETEDEFNELGEAFNRMLRHLTETEMEVRKVNSELDRRVDQLAQVNLQLYEANRLKSEFLANMSHELRTPLNSILGFSEVLQNFDSLSDKQKRYAGNIQRSGRLLLDMINDILDLAKVEAGKMQVRSTHFDVVQLVFGQCDVVRSLSEEKNIDLQVESKIESISVYTDQPKIQQILTNLLSNAIKFTPEGGLITVQTGLAEGDRFYISVADTGVGIAESDFEIIFEKFRQSRATTGGDELAREYSGTGLGLSIVRELCKLLGGEVMLSSQLGQGSVFQIELPLHYVPPTNTEESIEVSASGTKSPNAEPGQGLE